MNRLKRELIFERFAEQNPNPVIELNYNSVFELLIAVILSAQSTDVGVNKATPELFAVADTPEKMLQLGEIKLKNYIKTLGLYNSKAKNIIKTCAILIKKHNHYPSNYSHVNYSRYGLFSPIECVVFVFSLEFYLEIRISLL